MCVTANQIIIDEQRFTKKFGNLIGDNNTTWGNKTCLVSVAIATENIFRIEQLKKQYKPFQNIAEIVNNKTPKFPCISVFDRFVKVLSDKELEIWASYFEKKAAEIRAAKAENNE